MDAQTIADWQVDMLKLDVCALKTSDYGEGRAMAAF
jgi:Alpha galactosidase A